MGERSEHDGKQWHTLLALAVSFLVSFCFIQNRFHLVIDEGITLTDAERVARGQQVYRDVFLLAGPGFLWLQGGLFHLFGASLANAQALLCSELAVLSTSIYSLVARFAKRSFATASALLFLASILTSPYRLHVTHRWGSNALAVLAAALAWAGVARSKSLYFALAGVAVAAATWCTPPLAMIGLAIGLWICWLPNPRWQMGLYCVGIAIPTVMGFSVIVQQGISKPMMENLLWSISNYGTANSVRYGSVSGDTQAAASIQYIEASLPAALPLIAYAGCILSLWFRPGGLAATRRLVTLLIAFSVAALAACYPRFGSAQLWFASGIFWVLCSLVVYSALSERWRTIATVTLLFAAVLLLFQVPRATQSNRIVTRVGELQVSKRHHILISTLQSRIQPGDSLFVYPYLPVIYFITGGQNPTRYSYLQPGMMTADDEASALRDLEAKPPRWIVWHDFPREFVLKNWPNSDPNRLNFPRLEAFFTSKYHLANPAEAPRAGYRLLERNEDLR